MKRLVLILLLLFALLLASCTPLFEGNTGTTHTDETGVGIPDADPNKGTPGGEAENEDTPTPLPPQNPPLNDGFPNTPEDEGTKRY